MQKMCRKPAGVAENLRKSVGIAENLQVLQHGDNRDKKDYKCIILKQQFSILK